MDIDFLSLEEMKSLVGVSEELTEKVLQRLKTLPPSTAFLPMYHLLLLERFENTIPLAEQAMRECLDLNFIRLLQSSRFYLHRMAVPAIIKGMSFPEKKELLRAGLRDEICDVVERTVASIKASNPFTREELVEIAFELFRNKYTAIKVLCVDIVSQTGCTSFLLEDLLRSTNWRMRLKVASRVEEFSWEDRGLIIEELVKDPLDEIRVELSKHLTSLDQLYLVDDPNELVRANYLRNVVDQIEDEHLLRRVLEDKSWEVRKQLLRLSGERFKRITVPLIRNKIENVAWRDKLEIFKLVEDRADDAFVSKFLMVFLLKHARDKVYEVRRQAQKMLVRIVRQHAWVEEYYYELEILTKSQNYLHRVTIAPVIVEYDARFGTQLGYTLKEDPTPNVRQCFNEYCEARGALLSYTVRPEATPPTNPGEDTSI